MSIANPLTTVFPVFILIEMLRELKEAPYDVYRVFTVQEEVGIRGANVATQEVQPDFGFGLDTTIAFDVPGAAGHEKITELGKGTAIKVMDSSTICDYRMVDFMKENSRQAQDRISIRDLNRWRNRYCRNPALYAWRINMQAQFLYQHAISIKLLKWLIKMTFESQ